MKKTEQYIKTAKIDMQRRIAILVIMDILCVLCAFFVGLWLRYDFHFGAIPEEYLNRLLPFVCIWCVICVAVYAVFRLYHSIWRFASVDELLHIIAAYIVLGVICVAHLLIVKNKYMPYSFYVLGFIFSFAAVICVRFSYRLMRGLKSQFKNMLRRNNVKNIMIVGAGEAGRILANEFQNNSYAASRVVCAIDDNPIKKNKRLCGVPIVGNRYDIPKAAVKYNVNSIIFAIPACSAELRF